MRGIRVAAATVGLSAALTGTAIGVATPAGASHGGECTPGSYPPSHSTVSTSRSRAEVGMRMRFEARCFASGERVRATVFSEPVRVGTYTANARGAVEGGFTVPKVTPGRHTLELRGLSSGTVQTTRFVVAEDRRGRQGSSADNDSLAFTGGDFGTTAGIGALLVAGGGALLMAARRRKHVNAPA